MKRNLWKYHRRLAWLAGITAILWAASGLMHPLMNFSTPQPATYRPPAIPENLQGELNNLIPPTQLPVAVETVQTIRLVAVKDKPVYQISVNAQQPRQYFNAITGKKLLEADKNRAISLANHYTGKTNVKPDEVSFITNYSLDYPTINKFLPAWRVRFSDELVYVETSRDSLVRLSNINRQRFLKAFQVVHTMPFLPEIIRVPVLTIIVGAVLLTGLFGAYLLFKWPKRKGKAYRLHRTIGWMVLVPFLAYPISGLLHLWTYAEFDKPIETTRNFSIEELVAAPTNIETRTVLLSDLKTVKNIWQPHWRCANGQWFDRYNTLLPTDDEDMVPRVLGSLPTTDQLPKAALIQTFGPKYGFSNRILPVWRYENQGRIQFVDVQGGTVVNTIGALDKAELWSFNILHKWQFLRGWGIKNRDILQIIITSLIIFMAFLGIVLRKSRKTNV